VDDSQLEAATSSQASKASLGEFLVAARDRRGLSLETVVRETHIPAYYLRMLEDGDYRLISDRLYLLPFLRRYAGFLDIDPDETAMRLLRDVQRVDNSPSPIRLDEPLDDGRRSRRRNWSKAIMFGGLIAVIIGAYIAQSRHKDADTIPAPTLETSQASVCSPSSFPSIGAVDSLPAAAPTSAVSANRPDSIAGQRSTSGTTTSTRGDKQAASRAMMVPVMSRGESPNSTRGSAQRARRVPSH